MQISTQLSLSSPPKRCCIEVREEIEREKGDGQEFLLHQPFKSLLRNVFTSLGAGALPPASAVSRLWRNVGPLHRRQRKCSESAWGEQTSVAMENVTEWSGTAKNGGDDSRSFTLAVNYSKYLQLTFMLRV